MPEGAGLESDAVATLTREVEEVLSAARAALESGTPPERVRADALGRKGRLKTLMKRLGELPAEARPAAGRAVQKAVAEVERMLSSTSAIRAEAVELPDLTRTPPPVPEVLLNPLLETQARIVEAFRDLGFAFAEGPEIETDRNNFTDLGFPDDHPARDAQDTFYLDAPPGPDGTPLLLRTHTSPVQLRAMEVLDPPLRLLVPGRTYRSDAPDAGHSPIFHQVEGLVVEPGIRMSHLKGTLAHFARRVFGPDRRVRFRPSYFPFTEPSAEVDVSCPPCPLCKGTGWLEILGAGLVAPTVFRAVCRRRGDDAYDPEATRGFAFGMGVERVAMIRHGISDMRLFYENDLRFLRGYRA